MVKILAEILSLKGRHRTRFAQENMKINDFHLWFKAKG